MSDDPKERILRAAMRCFADKGYAATTMADIEQAAGFQPRTGGTYRHFRSKYAILDAALDRELGSRAAATASWETAGSALETARAALRALDDQRDLMKVLFRDLDAFPELFERMSERLIQSTYRETADRIASLSSGSPDVDAEAIAAVTVGSLVNFKIIEAFTGRTPNDVDDERFAQAWATIVTAAATAGAASQQVPS